MLLSDVIKRQSKISIDNGGSATSPSISHNNTANGIFFPAANTVAFSTNGTERARITDTGTTQVTNVSVTSGGSASLPSISHNSSNNGIFFPASNTMAFATNGTERARIDSNGRVQMSKTTGWYKLFWINDNLGTGNISLTGSISGWTWYFNTTFTTSLVVEPGTYDAYATVSLRGYRWIPYSRAQCCFSIDGSTPDTSSPFVMITSPPASSSHWIGSGSGILTNLTTTSTNNLRVRVGLYSGGYASGNDMSVYPNDGGEGYYRSGFSNFSILLIRK